MLPPVGSPMTLSVTPPPPPVCYSPLTAANVGGTIETGSTASGLDPIPETMIPPAQPIASVFPPYINGNNIMQTSHVIPSDYVHGGYIGAPSRRHE